MGENFQFCYVLTGGGAGEYAAMVAVSASFLRHLYPRGEDGRQGARIVVVCDQETAQRLPADHPIRGLADEVMGVRAEMPTTAQQSRYLKTTLRKILRGAFVFLDADTLPVRRFDELFELKGALAAVPDWNCQQRPRMPGNMLPVFAQMGWRTPANWYFNSGVVYVNDTPEARRLYELWHEKWRVVPGAGGSRGPAGLQQRGL